MSAAERLREESVLAASVGVIPGAGGCWAVWLDSGLLRIGRDSHTSTVSCADVGRSTAAFCQILSTDRGVVAGTTDGCLVLLCTQGAIALTTGMTGSAVRHIAPAPAEAVWVLHADGHLALTQLPGPGRPGLRSPCDPSTRLWRLGRQHTVVTTNTAAARTPSLFDDWLEPAPAAAHDSGTAFSPGIVAAAPDPCLSSYALPRAAPSASLGALALEAAAGLARLANSMAMQWGVGRAALSGLGWGERGPAAAQQGRGGGALEARGPQLPLWELVPGGGWQSEAASPQTSLRATGGAATAAGEARAPITALEAELRHEATDRPRAVRQLVTAPSGRAILSADDQGRVLLLDGSDLAVLRMWKGYREASLGWLHAAGGAADLVTIFAPRRGQVDVWDLTSQAKLGSVKTRRRGGDALAARMVYAGGRCFIVQQLQGRPRPPQQQQAGSSEAEAAETARVAGGAPAARPPPQPEGAVDIDHRGARLVLRLRRVGEVHGVRGEGADLVVSEVTLERGGGGALTPVAGTPPPGDSREDGHA